MNHIIIAGYGYVGKAVEHALQSTSEVSIVDPQYNDNTIADFPDADGVVICVGTPSTATGDCDVGQIYKVMDQIPIHLPVLIKSTIRPDYLNRLLVNYPRHSICYSPELLRAATANTDFISQKYMIIGGEDPESFWQLVFQKALPECKLFLNCSLTEAALVKYSINAFLSVKVTFFNQLYDVCQKNGADFNLIRQLMLHDTRIGTSHTMTPGPDGTRGFGGGCFPKDMDAYIHYIDTLQQSHTLVESAIKYNKKIRKNT